MKPPTKSLLYACKISLGVLYIFSITNGLNAQEEPVETILQSFVESYKTDPMALSASFGIKVGEQWWTVKSDRSQEAYAVGKNKQYTFHNFGPHKVELRTGKPKTPTWYFIMSDRSVLDRLNDKNLTASTASAKSTPSDETEMNILDMDGFQSTTGTTGTAYQVMEHFWKKDSGEVTYFNRSSSLPSHGAEIVALYTMKDKRINWFSLGTQEAANADRGLDKGQVPNLFIITKGRGKAQIGEQMIDLEEGMSVFVGPYVKHILYNPYEEPLEGILVLFGDNIDFAKGQSYIDFVQSEYEFYNRNEAEIKQQTLNN